MNEVYFETTTSKGTLLILERGTILIITAQGGEVSLPIGDLQEICRHLLNHFSPQFFRRLQA